jgi:hypothetical protein
VLVRRDLSVADQLVQVAHAAMETGRRFPAITGGVHLVVLSVPDRAHLDAYMQQSGIGWVTFDEPDRGIGVAAACSWPTTDRMVRKVLQKLPLWEP